MICTPLTFEELMTGIPIFITIVFAMWWIFYKPADETLMVYRVLICLPLIKLMWIVVFLILWITKECPICSLPQLILD